MNHSETLTKIAPALVAALGKIEGAAKKKTNPGFKSKYADLETVIDASRDILTEHGLTVMQFPGACSGGVLNLETVIMHESGEWVSAEMGIALGKTDPQGVGSAVSYARRYALMAALNMPAVDDDGEASMGRARQDPTPSALDVAKQQLIGATSADDFKAIWAKLQAGAPNIMSKGDYAQLVDFMKHEAKRWAPPRADERPTETKPEPAREERAFAVAEEEIPF